MASKTVNFMVVALMGLVFPITMSGTVYGKDSNEVSTPKVRTARGHGAFQVGRDKPAPIVAATASQANHKMTLVLTLRDGTTLELNGKLSGEGRTHTLNVQRGLGKETLTGTGQVSLSQDKTTLQSVTGSGVVDGDNFSYSFTAGNVSAGNTEQASSSFSYSDDIVGGGRYDLADRKMRVTGLHVTMSRSHGLRVQLHGPELSGIIWEGTWAGSGPEYSFNLRHAGEESMDVRGKITFTSDRQEFVSIEGEGKVYGEDVRLYFGKQ